MFFPCLNIQLFRTPYNVYEARKGKGNELGTDSFKRSTPFFGDNRKIIREFIPYHVYYSTILTLPEGKYPV